MEKTNLGSEATGTAPVTGFAEACPLVLQCMASRVGFSFWMVTRTDGDDWIVLACTGTGYPVQVGDRLCWSDSICSRMYNGMGPQAVQDVRKVQQYAVSEICQRFPILSYIGVPIEDRDGQLFGTLCGIDPEPYNESLEEGLADARRLSRLLGGLLSIELQLDSYQQSKHRRLTRSLIDPATGWLNREGWFQTLQFEERRSQELGSHVAVIQVDALQTDVSTLAGIVMELESIRFGNQTLARLDQGRFVLLLNTWNVDSANQLAERLNHRLSRKGHAVHVENWPTSPPGGLTAYCQQLLLSQSEHVRDTFVH